MTRIAIFDYGAGNLHSLAKSLARPNVEVSVETDALAAIGADALILPGVGAFGAAARALSEGRVAMRDAILGGLPTLGICLGMQLLFDASDEGAGEGLGVIPGQVRRINATRLPHIGWNAVEVQQVSDPLAQYVPSIAYFANSYVCQPTDDRCVVAYSTHENDRFPVMVVAANAVGVQFHPEKSSSAGVRFVHEFVSQVSTGVFTR